MILYGGSMYVRDSTLAENRIMISGGGAEIEGEGGRRLQRGIVGIW